MSQFFHKRSAGQCLLRLAPLGIVLVAVASGRADDWPQWRGPNRDGVMHGVKAPARWPETLAEAWKVEVGHGCASPLVVGQNVYVFVRQNAGKDQQAGTETGNEVVLCLDRETGEEHWRSEPYAASYKPSADADFPWPRSTPTIVDGRIFTLGMTGVLSCLELKTGKLIWRKQCEPYIPYGGNSPLVTDGVCIVHFGDHIVRDKGGVTAFDVRTGEVKWVNTHSLTPSSSSPIAVELAGERQAVFFDGFGMLYGLSVATGEKLWELRDPFNGYTISSTPIHYKDLLIFAGWAESPRAIRLEKKENGITPVDVWGANVLPLAFSSPVPAGDLMFGQSTRRRSCLFCLEAATGKTLWESDGGLECDAAIVNGGDVWLALTVKGKLIVVRPSDTQYDPIAEYQVSDTQTWAHPVFLGDRILIKDQLTLRSLRTGPSNEGR